MTSAGYATTRRRVFRSRVRQGAASPVSSAEIAEAIRMVKRDHPIPGYVDQTAEELQSIAELLTGLTPRGASLLDIGCGALDKTAVFQLLGYKCCACDDFADVDDYLQPLENFATFYGIDFYRQTETHSLPWEPTSFDVVTILAVIEHLKESPREILNTAGLYLKSGGLLVVVMPNAVNLRKRLSVIVGKTNYPPLWEFYNNIGPWRGHVREYTLRETVELLQWSGFEVTTSTTYHGMIDRRLRSKAAQALYKAVCRAFPTLKDSLFVAARKPDDWKPKEADREAAKVSHPLELPQGKCYDDWLT